MAHGQSIDPRRWYARGFDEGAPRPEPASDATLLGVTSEGALESAETLRADRRDDPSQPRLPGRPSDLGLVARGAIPAELKHSGIVPVYEHGALDDGRPWHR